LQPASTGEDRVRVPVRFSADQNDQLVPAYADC
jgi:hypothetical protein